VAGDSSSNTLWIVLGAGVAVVAAVVVWLLVRGRRGEVEE
jgi:uncharacterized membrane protein